MSARDAWAAPRGAGGGSGGGGGTEQPDSLRSIQIADTLDLISEGECVGPTNGLRSIYYDGVPLQNADGTFNFENVQVQWVLGTQGQAAIAGADGVQTEVGVGVTVLATTPVVRTISNAAVDTVRVTIAIPQLTLQDTSNGDLKGAVVDWAIDVQSAGGGFVQVAADRIDGKTTSRYTKAIEFKLTGAAPWDVRVRRITADSTTVARTDAFAWSSYTEIQSLKLRYPNSALVRTRLDAKAFSRVPVRAFDWMGIRVQVPTNYDPMTKSYSGVWNGTFKSAWTDCPAWLFWELVTNPRWGLGRYFDVGDDLKWELYGIGRYCDEMVPDGRGGTEPRFRAGLVMSTREQAYKWLTDVAAIFRGMTYWGASDVRVTQDAPDDVAAVFTNANVIGGKFTYSGASHSKRHSQVVVWRNSMADFGKLVPEVVVDRALQARYGIRSLEISPLGVWSRGQAQRIGKWALFSEQYEGALCAHSVGFDGALVAPGAIYEVADAAEAGERLGGRVHAATTTQVTLDADVTLAAGEAYTLTVMLPDPGDPTRLRPQVRPVTTPAGTARTLALFPALTAAPATATVWLLRSTNVQPTSWRCLAVRPVEGKNEYEITGIRHFPAKYALIEQGTKFEVPSVSRIKLTPPAPAVVNLLSTLYAVGAETREKVTASWPEPASGLTYLVSWRLNSGPWTDVPPTNANSVDIDQLQPGLLEVTVRSRNALGNVSAATEATPLLLGGKTELPAAPSGLTPTVGPSGWTVRVADPPEADWTALDIRIDGSSWDSATAVFKGRATRAPMQFLAVGSHVLRAKVFAGTRASTETTYALQVNAPSAPTVTGTTVSVGSVDVRFSDCTATQPLRQVLCRLGSTSQQWADLADYGAAGADARSLTVVFGSAGTRRIFLRGVDVAGNLGDIAITDVVPAAQDTATILALVANQIEVGSLGQTLRAKVNLIDGPASLAGSVAAQVAMVQGQVNTLLDTPFYDPGRTYDPGAVVKDAGKLYRAKQTTTGHPPTDTTFWEKVGDYDSLAGVVSAQTAQLNDHESRITSTASGLVVESSQRSQLEGRVDTLGSTLTGAISSEASTRITERDANAKRVDSVIASSEQINLVSNPSFARGANWNDAYIRDAGAANVPAGAPARRVFRSTFRDGIPTDSGTFPVTPGEVLELEVYIGLASAIPVSAGLLCTAFNAAAQQIGQYPGVTVAGTITGWRRAAGTITVPAGCYLMQPNLYVAQTTQGYEVHFAAPAVRRQSAGLASALATVITNQQASVDRDGALGSRVDQVAARLNSGGDVAQSLVQVSAQAAAAAEGNATNASQISTVQSALSTRAGGAALNSDPYCRRADQWEWGGHGSEVAFVENPWGRAGTTMMASMVGAAQGSSADGRYGVPLALGRRYRVSAWFNRSPNANGYAWLRYVTKTNGNQTLAQVEGVERFSPPHSTWTKYEFEFTPTASVFAAPRVILNHDGGGVPTGQMWAQDVRIEDVTDVVNLTATVQQASSTSLERDNALGQLISTVNARLENGGDVAASIVQVATNASTARSVAEGAAGSAATTASQITTVQSVLNSRAGGTALNSDPFCRRADQWEYGAYGSPVSFVDNPWGVAGTSMMASQVGAGGSSADGRYGVPVVAGRRYRVSAKVNKANGANGSFYLRYVKKNASHETLGEVVGVEGVTPAAAETWTPYAFDFVATSEKFVAPRVILNFNGSAGQMWAQDVRIEDVTDVVNLTATVQQASTTSLERDNALGQLISTVNARLENGGDVAASIVQVATNASTARSVAEGAAGSAATTASQITTVQSVLNSRAGGTALNSDPFCRRADQWEYGAYGSPVSFVDNPWGVAGTSMMASQVGAGGSSADGRFGTPTVKGRHYRLSAKVIKGIGANGLFDLRYVIKDAAHATLGEVVGVEGVTPAAAETWTTYAFDFVATSEKFVAPRVILNFNGSAGQMWAQDVRIEDVTDLVALQNASASVVQSISTLVSEVDGVQAQYALKAVATRNDGKVVLGFIGVSSTAPNDNSTGQSEILLAADRLVYVPISNPNAPFTQLLVAGLRNGVNTLMVPGAVIGDLQVDTLQIANHAVNLPVSSFVPGEQALAATVSTIASATITSTGQPISISAGTCFKCVLQPVSSSSVTIELWRGGTQLVASTGASFVKESGNLGTVYATANLPPLQDTPGVGTYTYLLKSRVVYGTGPHSDVFATSTGIVLMETKKMTAFTVVDATGEIVRALTVPNAGHLALNTSTGETAVEGWPDSWSSYRSGTQWVQKPAKPSEFSVWSGAAKVWVDPRNLEQLKAAKRQKIKASRTEVELGTFTWDGSTFDGDSESQRRLQGAVLRAMLAASTGASFSVDWTLADDSVRVLNAADMLAVGDALAAKVDGAFATGRTLQAAIKTAADASTLEAVTWPT